MVCVEADQWDRDKWDKNRSTFSKNEYSVREKYDYSARLYPRPWVQDI